MRLMMMGTGPFAVPTFNSLLDSSHEVIALVTRPVEQARGRRKTPANPMRDVAESRDVPIMAPPSVNDQAARDEIQALHADLFVVCDYGQILSPETLAISQLGGINLHGSLLPRYRGAAPVNWAIYNGDPETGVTVIHMSPKLDAGPCLVKRSLAIDASEDAVQLEERLSQLGVQPVHESIEMLANWDRESPIGEAQDPTLATKAPRIKKNDGLVDWSRSAEQIRNQVRAFKPWPGTFSYWHRESGEPMRLIFDQVSVSDLNDEQANPGQVVQCDGKRLIVAASQSTLSIDKVQPAGKRAMAIDEFLRGHKVCSGERFGSLENA